MSGEDTRIQALRDAGCSREAAERILLLQEAGNSGEALRQMKKQRCLLIERMHESQRKVDRMDLLIRDQEKRQK